GLRAPAPVSQRAGLGARPVRGGEGSDRGDPSRHADPERGRRVAAASDRSEVRGAKGAKGVAATQAPGGRSLPQQVLGPVHRSSPPLGGPGPTGNGGARPSQRGPRAPGAGDASGSRVGGGEGPGGARGDP